MDNPINIIEEMIENNNLSGAEEKAREWLLQNQDDLKAKVVLARVLLLEERQAESEAIINEILETDEQNIGALSLLAWIREWEQRFTEAKDILLKLLPLSKNKARVNFRIGKILSNTENKEGNTGDALKHYREAVTNENPPAEAFEALAYAEQSPRAVYVLQHGISQHPDNVDLWFDLCNILYDSENYLKCIEAIEEAETKGVEIEDGAWIKVYAYYHLQRYEDALKTIRTIQKQGGRNQVFEDTVEGLLNYLVGDYQEAERILSKVIEEDVVNSLEYNGHILLTSVYISSSKVKDAERVFVEIPTFPDTHYRPSLKLADKRIWLSLSMNDYYTKMLEQLKSSATSRNIIIKVGYLYSVDSYSSYTRDFSKDELRQLRDDLLAFVSEGDMIPITANEHLYNVSADLGEWINAIDYYLGFIRHDNDRPRRIREDILEGVSRNRKQFEKLLTLLDKHSSYHNRKSLLKIIGQLIYFFFEKKKFAEVFEMTEKFTFDEILETNSAFAVAYSCVKVEKHRQAKNFYKAILDRKRNSAEVANNLALLEEQDGNLIEAERLLRLAVEWNPTLEAAKTNHTRVLDQIQKENEKKRAYQRAVDLYQQEQDVMRFFLARLYSTKTDDGLIFINEEKLKEFITFDVKDEDIDIELFVRKKYLDEVSDEIIQFDGRLFRFNPALVPLLLSDLESAQEREIVSELAKEMLSKNLGLRYGYNSKLQDSLRTVVSSDLSDALQRDLHEIVIALVTKSHKSALILCGSVAEAILLDKLSLREASAISALERVLSRQGKTVSASDRQLSRWSLDRLLDVAFEDKVISKNLYHWGHGIRGFRNLVHPGLEQTGTIEISRENAEMAWNVVKRLISEMEAMNE